MFDMFPLLQNLFIVYFDTFNALSMAFIRLLMIHIDFPKLRTKAILVEHDIYINATPVESLKSSLSEYSLSPTLVTSICHDIKQFDPEISVESA